MDMILTIEYIILMLFKVKIVNIVSAHYKTISKKKQFFTFSKYYLALVLLLSYKVTVGRYYDFNVANITNLIIVAGMNAKYQSTV